MSSSNTPQSVSAGGSGTTCEASAGEYLACPRREQPKSMHGADRCAMCIFHRSANCDVRPNSETCEQCLTRGLGIMCTVASSWPHRMSAAFDNNPHEYMSAEFMAKFIKFAAPYAGRVLELMGKRMAYTCEADTQLVIRVDQVWDPKALERYLDERRARFDAIVCEQNLMDMLWPVMDQYMGLYKREAEAIALADMLEIELNADWNRFMS
ncbi:uncharacterized protein C8Q71DRAFT_787136 [Rhodofomes roseus]|uniref:Zn(2)-C6 fungal-type domain-containing protein n=1 Tax=Rhodofomes roseus TaxID=34475 RepID=A0ABQ8K119_9APHY|nr:uncharacterized protein C8Q71DRAFT_787136 [Rhodofomes roseus]KAH9830377.1 hypothetical protein C8Q71DRAFT_787136 [Rhodofomes roseus]